MLQKVIGKRAVGHSFDRNGRMRIDTRAGTERISAPLFLSIGCKYQAQVLPGQVLERFSVGRFQHERSRVVGFPGFGKDTQMPFLFHWMRWHG